MQSTNRTRASRWHAVAGFALMLACAGPSHATLVGDSVTARLFAPNGTFIDPSEVDLSATVIVGPDIEIAAGGAEGLSGFMLANEYIDFGASSIVLRVGVGNVTSTGALVTGLEPGARYEFSGLDYAGGIITGLGFSVGANQIANLATLGTSWITLTDPNTIRVDLSDIVFSDGPGGESEGFALITIDLVTEMAPIPEPSTWLLLAAGLGGLVLVARRKGGPTAAA